VRASSAFSGRGRWRAHPQPGDPPAVQFQDRDRPALDLDGVADLRQPPELGEHVPGDGLVRALGQREAGHLGEVVEVQQSVDLAGTAGRLLAVGRDLLVVLVVDLPDDLLDEVLERHDPVGAAVLVDHDRQMLVVPSHLAEGGEDGDGAGQPRDLPGQVAHGGRAAGGMAGQQQVAHVHEADDVVLVAADHRKAGPVGVGDLLGGAAGGHGCVEELDLRAGGHHLADLALTGAEDLVDEPALVAGQ